ncbi:death domain-associated protein 6 isoform X2 [Stigmatopora argus]
MPRGNRCCVLNNISSQHTESANMAAASASTAEKDNVRQSSAARRISLQSPFTSTGKNKQTLQVENDKLFSEFVKQVTAVTEDCPEVLEFLKTNHAKACPKYLSSVEFRNSLDRCLSRAEAKRSKVFVYIYELCMVLRQHKDRTKKKSKKPSTPEAGPSTSTSTSDCPPSSLNENGRVQIGAPAETMPSTSGLAEDQEKAEKRASRASRKQIAYLENLLKVYADEIGRLQRAELSLEDLDAEDSLYIQEHKLKRKMMMIYKKLCELKKCTPMTGRILERKILYADARYPEIGRKIQRYINRPDVCMNPPDFQDILQQVQLASDRHHLRLSATQLDQIARKAFADTGTKIQQRRYQDLLYDFGCQLTSEYKPENDPALKNPTLLRKLKENRDLGASRLEDVLNKYANQQEDVDHKDRSKRQGKEGEEEEEEAEEEEDDDSTSSETNIEEEIQASSRQAGPDDDEEDSDRAEELSPVAAGEPPASQNGVEQKADDPSYAAPLSDVASGGDSPGRSEPTQLRVPSPDEGAVASEETPRPANELAGSHRLSQVQPLLISPTFANNGTDAPESGVLEMICHSPITNGTCTPHQSPSDNTFSRRVKRKRLDLGAIHHRTHNSDVDVSLDMGVICASPPPSDDLDCQLVGSSQSPATKRKKVNVATQCDPEEIIELSDSD